MSPLRVLAVISSSNIGGAERVLATTLKSLDRTRVETSVVCPDGGPMVPEYRRHAAAVWTMDLGRVFDPRVVARLVAIMRQTRAELVHTQLWNADVLGALAARRAGIPILVTTVHGAYYQPIGVAGIARIRQAVLSRSYRAIYRRFDRVVAVARYVRDDLAERPGMRVEPSAIDVIPNGLDFDRVDRHCGVERAFASRPGPPRIVTVANLFAMKGHEQLLRAMPAVLAACPEVRCLLIGDGPRRAELESFTGRLGLADRVTFAGSVVDPLKIVRESDVFVLPSLGAEGSPIAVLEALALGTPVVATRAGGIPEVLVDGRTGLLVAPGEPAALAGAILNVLGDAALARRLSRAGREDVRARFAASATAARLETLYADAADRKGIR
jgi:glycosyltransferase involved in cell wall biosynthesis